MLTRVFALLLLANGLYFAWTQDALTWLFPSQREPERVVRQIQPDSVKIQAVLPKTLGDKSPATPTPPSTELVAQDEAPPAYCTSFNVKATAPAALREQIERAVTDKSWPSAVTWQVQEVKIAPLWLIYMGPYKAADALAKKKQELTALKVTFDAVTEPALQPGFSLGSFDQLPRAQEALKQLGGKGIRTAVIKPVRSASSQWTLALKANNAERLQALLSQQKKMLDLHLLEPQKTYIFKACT